MGGDGQVSPGGEVASCPFEQGGQRGGLLGGEAPDQFLGQLAQGAGDLARERAPGGGDLRQVPPAVMCLGSDAHQPLCAESPEDSPNGRSGETQPLLDRDLRGLIRAFPVEEPEDCSLDSGQPHGCEPSVQFRLDRGVEDAHLEEIHAEEHAMHATRTTSWVCCRTSHGTAAGWVRARWARPALGRVGHDGMDARPREGEHGGMDGDSVHSEGVPAMEFELFSSSFCGACLHTRAVLSRAVDLVDGAALRERDVALDPGRAQELGITATPTVIVRDALGREIQRASGVPTLDQVLLAAARAMGVCTP